MPISIRNKNVHFSYISDNLNNLVSSNCVPSCDALKCKMLLLILLIRLRLAGCRELSAMVNASQLLYSQKNESLAHLVKEIQWASFEFSLRAIRSHCFIKIHRYFFPLTPLLEKKRTKHVHITENTNKTQLKCFKILLSLQDVYLYPLRVLGSLPRYSSTRVSKCWRYAPLMIHRASS